MSTINQVSTVTVALLGNPNTGKSTLFNALSGIHQRTGNYPGVTVEKKEGRMTFRDHEFTIIDLPGTYSLAPRSPDEMITVDVLLGRLGSVAQPDVVVCIVDASNLERNLYLVSQVLELGRPTVIALNMLDVAKDKEILIDVLQLQKRLGVQVVEVQANRKIGMEALREAVAAVVESPPRENTNPFPADFQNEVVALEQLTESDTGASSRGKLPRYLVERLLLDTSGYLEAAHLPGVDERFSSALKEARARLAQAGKAVPGIEAISRYRWVNEVLTGVVTRPQIRKVTTSDRIDRILTHKFWGSAMFILVMAIMFQAVTRVTVASDLISDGIKWLAGLCDKSLSDGAFKSLLINGAIEGVGGVLVFLPQIFTLFFFIAVLEDCGYMARAAYLMDRLMSRIGLSGKSFIPLLSSFACAIPGIMAARVIENRRDRLVTILVAPLMSCSARLPVYILLTASFIPHISFLRGWVTLSGLVILAMYAIGILAAVIVALILKKTILQGATPPFVMELPSYKLPGLWIVLHRMLDRGWSFVRRAGTLIFAITILVWAAGYFPRDLESISPELLREREKLEQQVVRFEQEVDAHADLQAAKLQLKSAQDELSAVQAQIDGEFLRHSYLGRAGHWIEPVVRPLGWDWRIGCAAIASFPAREVIVATLGVIYNLGSDVDEESSPLQEVLRDATWEGTDRKVFNVPVALSLMVFFALCAQCASTLVIIRRETNSWGWPLFTFVYMTLLAYFGAFATYQIGMLI